LRYTCDPPFNGSFRLYTDLIFQKTAKHVTPGERNPPPRTSRLSVVNKRTCTMYSRCSVTVPDTTKPQLFCQGCAYGKCPILPMVKPTKIQPCFVVTSNPKIAWTMKRGPVYMRNPDDKFAIRSSNPAIMVDDRLARLRSLPTLRFFKSLHA
jgi:hypothetical protein